ncbi:MAG TPA: glycosyltransferase [Allosphingosinicella sp.]|nr:glycosyltransferase [Allosphingosinicella sp.]
MAEAAFFAILAAFAATYVGYPLLILLLAARRRPRIPDGNPPSSEPVSVIICAHDEELAIGAKLSSVLAAASEWQGAIEVIVADDGSGDRTADIVEEMAQASPAPLRLLRLPRGGKAAALARACDAARGELLVFTDADPVWDRQTLAALVAPFGSAEIGAVAGEVRTLPARDRSGFGASDALFRRYETAIRKAEDRLFGCVSADGGLFALRSALVEPVPPDVTDDFFLSTAAVARGYRIAFRPEAAVYEVSAPDRRQHFRRRTRITVRGLTGLWRRRGLMNPLRTGWYGAGLIFHKLLRRIVPILLIPLWLLAGWLAIRSGGSIYELVFGLLTGAIVLGLLLMLLPVRLPRGFGLPLYALLHVAGLGVGTFLFLLGKRYTQWTPQQRL